MYADRKKFVWNVPVANIETGETYTHPLTSFWDPEKDFIREGIIGAAVGEAFIVNRQRHTGAGDPVLLVG